MLRLSAWVRCCLLAGLFLPLQGCGFFTDGYTSTVLTTSAVSATYGTSVVFTAKVSDENSKLLTSSSGTVEFYVDSTAVGSATLSGGEATYTDASLTVGTHKIYAVFEGASPYNSSASDEATVVISSALTSTTTALAASATTLKEGASLTLTATVGIAAATGTVTFYDNTTGTPVVLGTGTLTAGVGTLSLSTLTVGTHTIYATYVGDSVYASSTSGSVAVTVVAAS